MMTILSYFSVTPREDNLLLMPARGHLLHGSALTTTFTFLEITLSKCESSLPVLGVFLTVIAKQVSYQSRRLVPVAFLLNI